MKTYLLTACIGALFLLAPHGKLLSQPYSNEALLAYVNVDVPAAFQGGGEDEYSSWVQERLVQTLNAEGKEQRTATQVVQFVVGTDGRVTGVQIIAGKHLYDEEIRRVMLSSPAWEPAKIEGKDVRQMFVLSLDIHFNPYIMSREAAFADDSEP